MEYIYDAITGLTDAIIIIIGIIMLRYLIKKRDKGLK